MSRVEDVILFQLGFRLKDVLGILSNAHLNVRLIKIPKKSGGFRSVFHPSRKLKAIQLFLSLNYLSKIPIHGAASAFVKGSSNVRNAEVHKTNDKFLKIDFEKFFESIRWQDLSELLRARLISDGYSTVEIGQIMNLVRRSCFHEDCLKQGYPTSPIISNIVMYNLDEKIQHLAKVASNDENAKYTRYADDIVISYKGEAEQSDILAKLEELIVGSRHPVLKINNKKTSIFSRMSGSASITGVRVCADQRLTLFRGTKDEIRLLLNLVRKRTLARADYKKTIGLLAYAKMVDPTFYSKMYSKYFNEIAFVRDRIL